MTKKIPNFKSYKKEAKFWDTHDVADFLPELKPVKLKVNLDSPVKETIAIRVQPGIKKNMGKIAKSYGINLSTLARIWFIDKLKELQGKQTSFN